MKNKDRIIEVITCKCGTQFAACSDGYQDDDWRKARTEYLKFGSSVDFIKPEASILNNRECPKNKEHRDMLQLKNQLKIPFQ